jgi:hypothetical protein
VDALAVLVVAAVADGVVNGEPVCVTDTLSDTMGVSEGCREDDWLSDAVSEVVPVEGINEDVTVRGWLIDRVDVIRLPVKEVLFGEAVGDPVAIESLRDPLTDDENAGVNVSLLPPRVDVLIGDSVSW